MEELLLIQDNLRKFHSRSSYTLVSNAAPSMVLNPLSRSLCRPDSRRFSVFVLHILEFSQMKMGVRAWRDVQHKKQRYRDIRFLVQNVAKIVADSKSTVQ